MANHKNTIICWFVEPHEVDLLTNQHIPFQPTYSPYLYFQLIKKGENTLEGYLGRHDVDDSFHQVIDSYYSYFSNYQNNKKVYMTMDKIVVYELIEILPSNPLLFVFKKLETNVPATPSTPIRQVKAATTVHRIHFEDLESINFERLVFAYVNRLRTWEDLFWLGESGNENGRDIWGTYKEKNYCYQCANHRKLPADKIKKDIDKLVEHGHIPDSFIVVSGGSVSATTRNNISNYAHESGIKHIEIWSGGELEERLRKDHPDILLRFFDGQLLPELESSKADAQKENKSFHFDDTPPSLAIGLEPNLHIMETDDEIALALEDAQFRIQKSLEPPIEIRIPRVHDLYNQYLLLSDSANTTSNKKKILELKKILIASKDIENEFQRKARLLFTANLYVVTNDFSLLVQSFKELLKLSISPDKLIEETDLVNYIDCSGRKEQPKKYVGNIKIDILQRRGGKIAFSIWLSDSELDNLLLKSPVKLDRKEILENLSFMGFECSDLSIDVFANKAIPAFIDKIYDLIYVDKIIDESDTSSWIHLSSYLIGLG
ncbi:hypothetical protein [Dinghuibacter silviterrae]|uniref:Restriction endonuclease n=1 Tax=Dinghuibacter silviterrae TaxID=1539049 RepID=A0A4V3GLZ3_9BACT|nr:hypothetical protein [Dinghuibacter silviterrae]TDX01463.1 hypothetical protein EDB95_2499 [Dinghuibacter silviterrae]